MTIKSVNYKSQITTSEELSIPAASNPLITLDNVNTQQTLGPSTTPPAAEISAGKLALVAGALTIDLTALAGSQGNIDGTGKRVQILKVVNPAGNNPITLKAGAANGYNLGNDANWRITLPGGDEVTLKFNGTNPVIAAGAKDIDVTGTLTESFDITIILG